LRVAGHATTTRVCHRRPIFHDRRFSSRWANPLAYRVVDIGTLGGDWMVGVAINNNGDIVGSASLPDGTLHAFRWTATGGVEDLGANNGVESHGFGINDNGDVVGVYFDHEHVGHPFIARRGDVMRDLSTIAGERVRDPYAITNDGRVAGDVVWWPSIQNPDDRSITDRC
jgi:probable HAF family extracellular repeat protein